MEIPGGWGGGSTNDPPVAIRGWGVKTKEPSMGGMDIFWKHTFRLSTIISTKKANKVLERWHVLAFYRIALCTRTATEIIRNDSNSDGRLK